MIGQVCVAIYPDDNNWHRVTITGIHSLDFVEVRTLEDIGNITTLKKEYPTSVTLKQKFKQVYFVIVGIFCYLFILHHVNHWSSTWK